MKASRIYDHMCSIASQVKAAGGYDIWNHLNAQLDVSDEEISYLKQKSFVETLPTDDTKKLLQLSGLSSLTDKVQLKGYSPERGLISGIGEFYSKLGGQIGAHVDEIYRTRVGIQDLTDKLQSRWYRFWRSKETLQREESEKNRKIEKLHELENDPINKEKKEILHLLSQHALTKSGYLIRLTENGKKLLEKPYITKIHIQGKNYEDVDFEIFERIGRTGFEAVNLVRKEVGGLERAIELWHEFRTELNEGEFDKSHPLESLFSLIHTYKQNSPQQIIQFYKDVVKIEKRNGYEISFDNFKEVLNLCSKKEFQDETLNLLNEFFNKLSERGIQNLDIKWGYINLADVIQTIKKTISVHGRFKLDFQKQEWDSEEILWGDYMSNYPYVSVEQELKILPP